MALEVERIASLEARMELMEGSMERIRNHISELLTFKNGMEGGIKAIQIMLGIVSLIGLGNLGLMLKVFSQK